MSINQILKKNNKTNITKNVIKEIAPRYNNDIIYKLEKIRNNTHEPPPIKIIIPEKINVEPYSISLNCSYNELTNFEVIKENIEIIDINKKNNKIIVSLTTIPPRIISDDFDLVIESLMNQILPVNLIIINLCKQYKRIFEYDNEKYNQKIESLKNKYKNIYINICHTDYGPATKLLGLCEMTKKFNDDDIIIILDDDWIMNNKMTFYYNLVYQLYQCDAIGINESNIAFWINSNITQHHKHIFYDKYNTYIYGWLSWSIKYGKLNDIITYFNNCINNDENMWKHDDLFFTMFYKKNNLYVCGMNLYFNEKCCSTDKIYSLREDNEKYKYRQLLNKKYNIDNYDIKYHITNIQKRYLLYNVNNIFYNPSNNNLNERHIDIKYFNKNTFMVTITCYSNYNLYETFIINNCKFNIKLLHNKQTFFYNISSELIKEEHLSTSLNIFQTSTSSNIDINKLYSICSILSYIPSCKYLFFDDNAIYQYINYYYPKCINIYENLIPGAYRADLFRLMYSYDNGGIYFDCKQILFEKESIILLNDNLFNDNLFVEDLDNNGIYNAFFIVKQNNNKIYEILLECLENLSKTKYGTNTLSITGPSLWGKYININDTHIKNIRNNNNTFLLCKKLNKIIIKNSYNNYYQINNYINTTHYSIYWNNKNVYHQHNNVDYYSNINGIDAILWINLDRATERKQNMEIQLQNINCNKIRVSGIDGKQCENMIYKKYGPDMTLNEICCTLSHFKAIYMASKLNGNYFLILEDDVIFENFIYSEPLIDIIKNAPEFDILNISKIHIQEMNNLYSPFQNGIYGTQAYIISHNGINKLMQLFKYNEYTNIFSLNNILKVADYYLYVNCNTIIYKYNLINETSYDSYIHPANLQGYILSTIFNNKIIIKDKLLNKTNITKYVIYGERCSGTNFLGDSINGNFNIKHTNDFAHKHFFGFNDYKNSDNVLFICIVRNIVDWLNSLYRNKFHLQNITLDNFLSKEIISYQNDEIIKEDYNYITNEPYKNIYELRKIKCNFLLNVLPKNVKNYIFIRYEDLRDNFDETLNKIKNKFNLIKTNDNYIMGKEHTYCKKKENKFDFNINTNYNINASTILNNTEFDKEIEESLNYYVNKKYIYDGL